MSNVNPAPAYLDEARYNIYHGIHKGIRYGHSRLLMLIGATDFADPTEAAVTAAEVRDFLMLGQGHLAAEEAEIHAALEAREPGASAHAEDDHAHHEISFKELETLLLAMEHAAPQRRAAEGRALYHRFALFTAADLAHMHAEETRMLAALHRNFTDAELHGIEQRIVQSIPAPKKLMTLKLMLPAMNRIERGAMLAGMRDAMPQEVFVGMMDSVEPALKAAPFADFRAAA